jgi:uncharacterized protein
MTQAAAKFDLDDEDDESLSEADSFFEGYLTAAAVSPIEIPIRELMDALQPQDVPPEEVPSIGAMSIALSNMRNLLGLAADGYAPRFFEDAENVREHATAWSSGFIMALGLRRGMLVDLLRSDEFWRFLEPIALLALRHPALAAHDGPFAPLAPPSEAEIEEAIDELPDCVAGLYEFRKEVLARQRAAARDGHRRIGRNDPCPCGSGRKFKKCCGG